MSVPDRPRGSVLGDGEETARTRRWFLGTAVASSAAVLGGIAVTSARADEEHGGDQALSRVRRWGMVIDLRRCDGCVGLGLPPQCAQFCNWSRFVPEGQEWLEVHQQEAGELPGGPRQFFPMLCMQCENAPCVNVCPVGATFHAPEGTVLIDQERCIGCRLCMAACPYDRRFFNWRDPGLPAGPCRTRGLALVGAGSPDDLADIAAPDRLVRRYGTEAPAVVAQASGDPSLLEPIAPDVDVTPVELMWALRHEGALDADDLLDRRTRIGLVPADRVTALPVVRDLLERHPGDRDTS